LTRSQHGYIVPFHQTRPCLGARSGRSRA